MILQKEINPENEIKNTSFNLNADVTKVEFLRSNGFILLGKLGELLRSGLPSNSQLNKCGVYSISKSKNYQPVFLTKEETKLKNNVIYPWSEEKLKAKWVENVDVLYYGLAGAKSPRSLRKRLQDLLKHGNGLTTDRGPHRGGEILWQLKGYENFELWVLSTGNPPEPRTIEEKLINQFHQLTGKLSFANRQF